MQADENRKIYIFSRTSHKFEEKMPNSRVKTSPMSQTDQKKYKHEKIYSPIFCK